MMRFCPKCRTFYDDEHLRFCLKDGVPLVEIHQADKIWSEGTNFIRETQRKFQSETRKQVFKKIVSMLITTFLVIMVISVITLNSWIYFTEPEKEIVQNKEPTPNPEPTYSPTLEIQITAVEEKTPTPTPTSTPIPTLTLTPTPTPKPTPKPTPTPTATPTPTPTPTPKPTPRVLPTKTPIVKVSPTITPTPIKCNVKQETAIIKNSYASFFRSKINEDKGDIFAQYLKGRQDRSAVELSTNINDLNISVANDCQTAKAIYPYIWVIYPSQAVKNEPIRIGKSRTFSCQKSSIWICN